MRRAALPLGMPMPMPMLLLLSVVVLAASLHQAHSAPVKEQEKKTIDKRRESTKETIELEETLKQLAGEDKKYFSNSLAMPMPQVDGLQTEVEGSGQVPPASQQAAETEAKEEPLDEQLKQMEDEEQQLMELPELQQDPGSFPVPGPFGPGLASHNGGMELEYEPSHPKLPAAEEEEEEEGGDQGEEEEEAEEEGEEEEYYLERVMDTLRRHPELLDELIHENDNADVSDENGVVSSEEEHLQMAPHVDERPADYDDRMEQIQAELDSMRAREQYQRDPDQTEDARDYILGDRESHVVSKKHFIIPSEYVKDDIESLNRYFDKYSGHEDSHADVPIM